VTIEQIYRIGQPTKRAQRKFDRQFGLLFWPMALGIFDLILRFTRPANTLGYCLFLGGAALGAMYFGALVTSLIVSFHMDYDPDEDAMHCMIDEWRRTGEKHDSFVEP
jgi:hypothetical protein